MPLRKVPVVWQTGIGGTGVSVFYTAFGVDATTELGTFFNAIKTYFPTAVTWDIPASGDVIDETTGLITGAWTAGTAASIIGSSASAYAGGTGAYVRWQTAGIVNGRRVRGRTFLCPVYITGYDTAGTLAVAMQSALQAAVTTLAAAGKLQVWHRPSSPGASDGSSYAVVAGVVPDKVTSLRSRRV